MPEPMPDMINCKKCEREVAKSDALPFKSRDTTTGDVEIHYACGQTCLVNLFNEHHADTAPKDELKI